MWRTRGCTADAPRLRRSTSATGSGRSSTQEIGRSDSARRVPLSAFELSRDTHGVLSRAPPVATSQSLLAAAGRRREGSPISRPPRPGPAHRRGTSPDAGPLCFAGLAATEHLRRCEKRSGVRTAISGLSPNSRMQPDARSKSSGRRCHRASSPFGLEVGYRRRAAGARRCERRRPPGGAATARTRRNQRGRRGVGDPEYVVLRNVTNRL